MSLKLYFHPLSSYCWKALIALYENDTPFEPHVVDLSSDKARAEFLEIWPIGKFPVLRDAAKDRIVPEACIIIEYLAQNHPGKTRLVPDDPQRARETRMRDRFYDHYVLDPVAKIVTDRLRPGGKNDPYGVEQAKSMMQTALRMIDRDMATKTWAMGEEFTMADCAAAPALFYANRLMPLAGAQDRAAAYLGRLAERPSFARVLREAQPYFALFPQSND